MGKFAENLNLGKRVRPPREQPRVEVGPLWLNKVESESES